MQYDILEYALSMQCPELYMRVDEETNLKAIIAIHSTALGPALGGCRCIAYPSTAAAAIDAIRLAQGMTYKAAISNLPLGGGKMVLLKPKMIEDRTLYFKAAGRFVDSLQGRYITAVDSGTSVEDMDIVATVTKHVTTTTHGRFSVSDPGSLTARGVVRGIEAAVQYKFKQETLKGIHVTIQGLGHAGYHLAKQLQVLGADLSVYDNNPKIMERAKSELNVWAVSTLDALLGLECDVFAPCALGAIINDDSLSKLKASIIAGCANNQLAEPRHGALLTERGILYAPDYVVNAGALIYVAAQYDHITEKEALQKIEDIYETLMSIFKLAEKEKRPTYEIADFLAQQRLLKKGG